MSASQNNVNEVDVSPRVDDPGLYGAIELFYYAFRAFTAQPDLILAERGLARLHHRILYFVARRPGQHVSDLLATLSVSKQALHAPLRQLVALGLVRVDEDPQDRRARCLSLSAEGAELEARLSQTQRELLGRVFAAQGADGELAWRQVMAELSGRARAQKA